MPSSRNISMFPTATCLPETLPFTPFPVVEPNPCTSVRVSFFASAPFTMAAGDEDVHLTAPSWPQVAGDLIR